MADARVTQRPLVIYLAGDRELYQPDGTVGVTGTLAEVVPHAAALPLADPPGPGAPDITSGTVSLLRLDRVSEHLADIGWGSGAEFLFVLTQQDDPRFSRRDTVHLRPLLDRWCRRRGHVYSDVVVHGPPNRLDIAAVDLLGQLDRHLANAERVVLVAGGGTAALQIAGHFASFEGVRHREALTIVQLEEVRAGDGMNIVDTRVRPVEQFHGVVGRRTLDQHALELLDALDLPGAAQLVRASRQAGLAGTAEWRLADELLALLARNTPASTAIDRLAVAVDLAEVEWSRPGGSHAEALWYAVLAAVELIPVAWCEQHGERALPDVDDEAVQRFNAAVADDHDPADGLPDLAMTPRYLRERALALLLAGPPRLSLPGRTVNVETTLGVACRQDDLSAAVLWLSLLAATKPLRNEHAHELVTLDHAASDTLARAASDRFHIALATLAADLLATAPDQLAARLDRCQAIRAALQSPDPAATLAHLKAEASARRGARGRRRNVLQRLAAGDLLPEDADLDALVADPRFDPGWFAAAAAAGPAVAEATARTVTQVEAQAEATGVLHRVAGVPHPINLSVTASAPASPFRELCGTIVEALPADNRPLGLAQALTTRLRTPR